MFKNAALAAAAALALAASPADAFKLTVYSDATCSGDPVGSGTSTSGACKVDDGNVFKVTCVTDESSSSWTYETFAAADTDCSDDATNTVTGTDSDDCKSNIKVDCGVQACYSGASTVQLEGGAEVPMSQLNPGDRVQAVDEDGNLFFDKVFRVTHWDQESTGVFAKITTDSGNTLELTGDHYVHVGGLEHKNLKLASEVVEGDELFVVEADGEVRVSPVTKVEEVKGKGLFNVHTLSSRVVVNGVVGSHFSKASTWGESNGKATLWYKLVDAASVLFGAENARLE